MTIGDDGIATRDGEYFRRKSSTLIINQEKRAVSLEVGGATEKMFNGMDDMAEELTTRTHYVTTQNGDPVCLGSSDHSTNVAEVDCQQCLEVIRQCREMNLGNWLD